MDHLGTGAGVEEVGHSREPGTVRTEFDQEKTPASLAVVATLAEATDVDVVDIRPLYPAVDPDTLDALVQVRNGTTGDIHVSFTHEDHVVHVHSDGVVTTRPEPGSATERDERDAER